ncbi:MAG: hypothetical protein ACK5HP_03950 [Bacilli bacterium]
MNETNSNEEIVKLIKFIVIITIILGVFYLITFFVTKTESNNTTTQDSEYVTIRYDKILIGSMFNQSTSEFYLLVELTDDPYLDTLESYLTSYTEKEESLKVYTADLNSVYNKKYHSETSSFDGQFPIMKETTLLKIKDNKVVEYYEGNKNVLEQLKIINS